MHIPFPTKLLSKSLVKQLENALHIIKSHTEDCCRADMATKHTKLN